MTPFALAAERYAAQSWPVFPCRPRAKEPLTTDGYLDATTDIDTVRARWRATPRANIGFAPGRAGLIVIDIDGPEGEKAAERLGLLSEPTLAALTPRGRHLYYHHPGGSIGNRPLAHGLDVRADRGYVLLPPSVHPSGDQYRWQGSTRDIVQLPPLALDALRRGQQRVESATPSPVPIDADTPRRRAYVIAAVEAECIELSGTPSGDRNNALNRAAWSLARFVATGEMDPARLADVLTYAAAHTGLPADEIERTIESAFRSRGVGV